jgi:HEAT repeat protein
VSDARQQLLDLVEHEFRSNTAFVRIHAAEVLCENGCGDKVEPGLLPEIDSTAPGYRIGVWRVMARIAPDEKERGVFQERIRRVLLDPAAPDRVHAAESLAKLGVNLRADRPVLEEWAARADEGTVAFVLWLLLYSSTPAEREADEARLARLLESRDEMARHRAAYALGRVRQLSPATVATLRKRAAAEPADSSAKVYLLSAAVRQLAPQESAALRSELRRWLENGKASEQFEAANAFAARGTEADRPLLTALLKSPDADPRIGAAGALLRLLR